MVTKNGVCFLILFLSLKSVCSGPEYAFMYCVCGGEGGDLENLQDFTCICVNEPQCSIGRTKTKEHCFTIFLLSGSVNLNPVS